MGQTNGLFRRYKGIDLRTQETASNERWQGLQKLLKTEIDGIKRKTTNEFNFRREGLKSELRRLKNCNDSFSDLFRS